MKVVDTSATVIITVLVVGIEFVETIPIAEVVAVEPLAVPGTPVAAPDPASAKGLVSHVTLNDTRAVIHHVFFRGSRAVVHWFRLISLFVTVKLTKVHFFTIGGNDGGADSTRRGNESKRGFHV